MIKKPILPIGKRTFLLSSEDVLISVHQHVVLDCPLAHVHVRTCARTYSLYVIIRCK